MRKILFRGKRIDNGEWVYGVPVIGNLSGVFMVWVEPKAKRGCGDLLIRDVVKQAEVIPETVGQYTGLKDQNGVKIFEGDVVYGKNIDDDILWVWYGVVKFNNYRLMLQEPKTEKWYEIDGFQFDKVIGNIYDNPELMEG